MRQLVGAGVLLGFAVLLSATGWLRGTGPLVLIAAFVLLFQAAWKRGRLRFAFLVSTPLVGALWVLTLIAINTDYRNASGLFDCWPSCTAFQHAVGFGFFLPIAFAVAAILVAASIAISRTREAQEK